MAFQNDSKIKLSNFESLLRTLISYINKKKSGQKNVIVLSAMHDNVNVTKEQRKKPSVHDVYDHTKGGVEVVDLLSTSLSTRIKCKGWPLNASGFILDRSNAETILQDKGIKMSNIEFTYSIEKALLLLAVRRRYENPNGLQMKIINKTRRFLSIEEVLGRDEPDNFITDFGRFFKCVESIFRTAHY